MGIRMMSDDIILKAFDQAKARAFMEIEGGPSASTEDVVNRIRELIPCFLEGEKND